MPAESRNFPKSLLSVVGVLLAAALNTACSSKACDATNCSGCCNPSGTCVSGTAESACGMGGATCAVCSTDFRCLSQHCVAPLGRDAGTADVGGAGQDASTDVDASASADAGSSPDVGSSVDAATTVEVPDAAVSMDAAVVTDAAVATDAGITGVDAATQEGDAGCAKAHDPKLGTLVLGSGYSVQESASIDPAVQGVASVSSVVYGLSSADGKIYALGTWPTLSSSPTFAYDVVAPADQGATVYVNAYLGTDGTRVVGGYTKAGAGFPGNLAVYDPTNAAASTYVSAPGNFSVAGVSGGLLVNSLGLATLSGGGVYSLSLSPSTKAAKVAGFDPAWAASSGVTATTTNGVAVLGYFNANDFQNYLRAVSPTALADAISGGTTIDLAAAPVVYSGGDLFAASGFGEDLVLHRGSYDSVTYAPLTRSVSRLPLTVAGSTVSVGTSDDVLTANDTCTSVLFLAPLASDLLVGVKDRNGARLVRISRP
ncbi:MAG: hypothetical protein QM765_35385 [Myxococcales bacterium]